MAVLDGIPDAWPLLLDIDQLEAYLGMDIRTIRHLCPVYPLDLGKCLVRYHRLQIDAWASTLPPRLPIERSRMRGSDLDRSPETIASEGHVLSPVEKARQRAQERQKCQKPT